jgi:hypothetical protein
VKLYLIRIIFSIYPFPLFRSDREGGSYIVLLIAFLVDVEGIASAFFSLHNFSYKTSTWFVCSFCIKGSKRVQFYVWKNINVLPYIDTFYDRSPNALIHAKVNDKKWQTANHDARATADGNAQACLRRNNIPTLVRLALIPESSAHNFVVRWPAMGRTARPDK